MLGEITMVQLYSVALTAGKAHKDHKHHHVHHFDHNGQAITTPAPPTPAPRTNQPTHPLLTAGQLNPALQLNLANPPQQQPLMVPVQLPNGQQFNAQLLNGQFAGNLVTQQLLQQSQQQQQQQLPQQPRNFVPSQPIPATFPQQIAQSYIKSSQIGPQIQTSHASLPNGLVHPSLVNPANVQFIDSSVADHQLYKRDNEKDTKTITKRQLPEAEKRALVLVGDSIVDDGLGYDPDLLAGLAGFDNNQPVLEQQKQNDEREPAEAEVMAVMKVCGGCDEEPFAKALIFGWRSVPKKLYSGAIYAPAIPQCRVF